MDGEVSGRYVGTAAPVRDPAHLARLFAEGLDGLDAGFGIEVMTLTVTSADSLTPRQVDLEARPNGTALPLLVDRLSRRLGPGRVHAVTSRPTFWPERLCAKAAPLSPGQDWPELPLRPVRLGPRPAPVVVSEDEGRPVRLEGRTDLVSVQGPERIETEWWLQPGMSERGRDYWRVESEDGARLWLFKELGSGRWFIHGSFG